MVKVADVGTQDGFKDGSNTGHDYEYDENGNMTVDKNKGISAIEYNLLNLPVKVLFEDGGTIEYVYDANGTKLQKRVIPTDNQQPTTTHYIDGYQYVNGKLAFYPHAEGYVKVNDDGTITYVYNYTDHLGNVRLSYADTNNDGKPEIVEESNYYPFGLKHKGYNNTANSLTQDYKYGYNGKEEQDELGLNWMDYQARNYDPALGRWFNHDPLSEASRRYSPYAYALDNPIYFIDPDGMLATPPDWYKNQNGDVQWHNRSDENFTDESGNQWTNVSDANNPSDYTLPNDGGTVRMHEWSSGTDTEYGYIDLNVEYIPNGETQEDYGWVQTIDSNAGMNTNNIDNAYDSSKYNTENTTFVDSVFETDPTKSGYMGGGQANNETGLVLADMIGRIHLSDRGIDVNWHAEATAINAGEPAFSLNFGMTLNPDGGMSTVNPTITNTTSDFHQTAIENLPKTK